MGMAEYETFGEQAQVALDALADVLTFMPSRPIEIVRWGFVVSVLLDNTPAALVAALDVDPQGAGARAASAQTLVCTGVDRAIGDTIICVPASPIAMEPGDRAFIEITTAATAGDGFPFVQYRPRGFHINDLNDPTTKVYNFTT